MPKQGLGHGGSLHQALINHDPFGQALILDRGLRAPSPGAMGLLPPAPSKRTTSHERPSGSGDAREREAR